ncbi:TIR domain-containing protein [Listeria booriae]|uniref:TIR domain-containing protein n=1 Tax=Listeria booriae TaxID=1552123 RepID=UPI0016233197|nr:TIR domain-containing protein [Listeria booriae]MBC1651599.1 TIR domain-containing protein [Listeria booriae]
MKRSVFYSFHYEKDIWRVSQIKNIGVVEGSSIVNPNDWEQVKRGGDRAIQNWIDSQLKYRSCTVVLIGEDTADRKWVKYEIEKSWNEGKGVLGIYIHNLLNVSGYSSKKGKNPFATFTVNNKNMSAIVNTYDPYLSDSRQAYRYISDNIASWVEDAILIRKSYR